MDLTLVKLKSQYAELRTSYRLLKMAQKEILQKMQNAQNKHIYNIGIYLKRKTPFQNHPYKLYISYLFLYICIGFIGGSHSERQANLNNKLTKRKNIFR